MDDNVFNRLSDMLESTKKSSNFNSYNNSNIQDTLNNLMSNFTSNNNSNNGNNHFDFSNIDMETITKIQNIMGKIGSNSQNPRSNLLLSLKPYLKPSKKEKLDQYMQFINIASAIEILNNSGGDK